MTSCLNRSPQLPSTEVWVWETLYVGDWITHAWTQCLNRCENRNSTELSVLKSSVAPGVLLIPGTIELFVSRGCEIYEYLSSLLWTRLIDFLLLQHLEGVFTFTLGKFVKVSVNDSIVVRNVSLNFSTGEWDQHWFLHIHSSLKAFLKSDSSVHVLMLVTYWGPKSSFY